MRPPSLADRGKSGNDDRGRWKSNRLIGLQQDANSNPCVLRKHGTMKVEGSSRTNWQATARAPACKNAFSRTRVPQKLKTTRAHPSLLAQGRQGGMPRPPRRVA